MRPFVMPRPIHLIFLASPLIVISSLVSPSTVKKSSRRRWRLPSWTGSAQSASCDSVDVMSGDSVSASSGTFGCSLRVRVIIGAQALLRHYLGTANALDLHRVVLERHRVDLLEQRPDVLLDLFVVGGAEDELPALAHGSNLAFFDDDLAALQHVARVGEQHFVILGSGGIDRHVGVGADAKMSLLREAERACRTGRSNDGDLGKGVFAVQFAEDDARSRIIRQFLDLFLPEFLVHQQPDDLGIAPEAPAVRVIGRQIYPPWILDEQQQLEPDGPLNGIDCMAIP